MARRTYNVSIPQSANDAVMPQAVREQLNAQLPYYQQQASAPSYYEQHPNKAIIQGFLGGAGLNALFMPQMIEDAANKRRYEAYTKWGDVYKSAIEQQKNIDGITQPRYDTTLEQQRLDALNRERMAQGLQAIPDLYQRSLPGIDGEPAKQYDIPNYSPEARKAYMDSAFGGSDINYKNSLDNYTRDLNYNRPSNALGGLPGGGGNTLQGGVKTQMGTLEPPAAPMFVNDPKTIMEQLTSAGNNALSEGQKRFEFDQEAPKRLAEIQKLLAEGKTEQARQLLMQAQTATERQRPALIRAQARNENSGASLKDRTNPNLRAPNIIDLMTPEQRAQYAAVTASGQNKPMTAADGINLLKLQNAAAEKDWAGNPTPTAINAQAVLNRMQGGGFAGQGASRTTSGKVSNGKTARAEAVRKKILGKQ